MAHLNEVKMSGMEIDGATAPKMEEREQEWLTIQGAAADDKVNSRWYDLFGQVNMAWTQAAHVWLTAQGVPAGGKINERFFKYWVGEIINPPQPGTHDPLEANPDWTVVGGPSTLEMVPVGEVRQDATAAPECLVYMNGSIGTDVIGQFRVTQIPVSTDNESFNIACRATDQLNFTGVRIFNGVYELWENTAGVLAQLTIGFPVPVKGDLVQMILSGSNCVVRVNGITYKPAETLTRLGAGNTGVICRAATAVPYSLGVDYAFAVA